MIPAADECAEFLDRLVHDLREPLRSVHAFTDVLVETEGKSLTGEGEEAIREILSGTARMQTLIDGLSGCSRALREPDASADSSLQLAFDAVADRLDKQIRAAGATVTGEALPRVQVSLERLMQLLENLIGNSLKFRGSDPPVIKVSAQADGDRWIVRIEDNGIGIDPADCEKVFKPFTRIHGRKFPGAGLGLFTCRLIAGAHGGEIRMSPRPRGGAVCTLRLPAAPGHFANYPA